MTLSISARSVVVDASVLVDAFLGMNRIGRIIVQRDLHAPVTVDVEVLHGVRRAWLAGTVPLHQAESALQLLLDADIVKHSVERLIPRMWDVRHNVSSYDAGYVALAESLDVPLLTRDRRLASSSGHTARIEYIA